ncbi:MAG: hypothetical protein ACYTET_01250 [Planctomycetota bacterium]
MRSRTTTFLLLGLMCFSSVSGFLTVICHGSDGHVAVEPVAHDHCQCPETDTHDDRQAPVEGAIYSADCLEDCQDILAADSFVVSKRKNVRSASEKSIVATFSQPLDVTQATTFSGYLASQSHDLYSFHVPIRTIVLLA